MGPTPPWACDFQVVGSHGGSHQVLQKSQEFHLFVEDFQKFKFQISVQERKELEYLWKQESKYGKRAKRGKKDRKSKKDPNTH